MLFLLSVTALACLDRQKDRQRKRQTERDGDRNRERQRDKQRDREREDQILLQSKRKREGERE